MKEMATQLWRGITRQVIVQHLLSMVVVVLVAIAAAGRSAAAPAPLGCDYNYNGICDAPDYTVWRNLLNTSGPLPNDSTPNWVDQGDYVRWKVGFGDIAGSGAMATTNGVPEPATGVSAALAMLMLVMRRRR